MAITLFHQRLQVFIGKGSAGQHTLTSVLSALVHLEPFQVMGTGEWGISWITTILDSKWPKDLRDQMISRIIPLLGKHLDLEHLSTSLEPARFGETIIPILTLTLSPPHALRLRTPALKVFHNSGWFSAQMKDVPYEDLENLLQAVGDPFQFTPDPLLQGEQAADIANYDPMMAVVVLIKFALSDLWRNHLQHSNFHSCEEKFSTEEGRRTALWYIPHVWHVWPESLRTASDAAVARLVALGCPNTARVVTMWAQTAVLSVE